MSPVRASSEREGQVLRWTLARPKANLLDADAIAALRAAVAAAPRSGPLKLVVIDHDGPHFSFGASVREHLPDQVAAMLGSFHALFRELEALSVPVAAVVRGQCLGGGLELALAAGRVFAAPSARFAVPEVKLGVFPPVGAVLLPLRVGPAAAAELVITGRTVDAAEALRLGLAHEVGDDPAGACLAWFDAHLAPLSAPAVRLGWRAARRPVARALREDLAEVERAYLDELMSLRDPVEGLGAFLEGRAARWEHA